MKLLYIHQYFAFPNIHSSTRSYDLASKFIENGLTVVVITTTTKIKGCDETKRWNNFIRDGINFWVLTSTYSQKLSAGKRVQAFLYFMFWSSVKAFQIKADIVLVTSTPITVAVPALIKRWLHKTPFIFEVRDVWPEIPVKMGLVKNQLLVRTLYMFEKLVYRSAAFIVPLSVGMEKSIQRRTENKNLVVIPNVSEINRFQNIKESFKLPDKIDFGSDRVVLYAGAMGTVNGIQYLARLAAETTKIVPSIKYIIIGVGKEKESIMAYCQSVGILNKSIFFLDPVPKSALPYLYSKCTVGSSFVIDNPVLWDNSANKFFDTLAAGKPIVINHEGWQADLIREKNIGFVLKPVVTENLAVDFVEYLSQRDLLAEQGQNAIKIGEMEFSLDIAAEKYIRIFGKLNNGISE